MFEIPQNTTDEFKSFIENHNFFFIIGHKEPDGDCITSCLGIAAILDHFNKPYQLLSAGPFKRNEVLRWQEKFSDTMEFQDESERKASGLIIADCSELSRLGDIDGDLKGFDTFVIDHHKTSGLEDGIKGSSMFKEAVKYMIKENGEMITVADIPSIHTNVKEMYLDEFIDMTEGKYPKFYEVFKYYISRGYKIYSEIGAFLIDYLLSGTIDVLLLRDDQFVIGDWKTNRGGLKFESGYYKKDKTSIPNQETDVWVTTKETLLPPVNNLPKCNGMIYNLQLSLYAVFVEYILGIPCAGLWLGHIDSDFVLNQYGRPKRFPDGLYHVKKDPHPQCTLHKMQFLRNEIYAILEDRRKEVEASIVTSKGLFDEME